MKVRVTVDHYVCGKDKEPESLVVSAAGGVRNAVIWLEAPGLVGTGPTSATVVQIDQQQCMFTPRLVVVPLGGTVEFLNSDRLLHNVHSVSTKNAPFNRTQPKDRTIPVLFPRPEIIRIDCDLHPWMRAWVVVAAHPFYAVTSAQGEFGFDRVPPGEYSVHVWHEVLGRVKQSVTLGDGVTAVTVDMPRK